MTNRFNLSLVQAGPTVGAIRQNAEAIVKYWRQARDERADLVAFPELFLAGYPPQDLVLKNAFIDACERRVEWIAAVCKDGPALGFGSPSIVDGKLRNAYFIFQDGQLKGRILKHKLPNVGVFDEMRLFDSGPICGPVKIGPVRIGVPICEDAWSQDVCEALMESGAEILLVANGSPYHRGKHDIRLSHMVARVIETGLPLAYLNMVGGQDDQIFDGGSFVLNAGGALAIQMPVFDADCVTVCFVQGHAGWQAVDGQRGELPDQWEQDYRAMVEAVRDFVFKNGFSRSVIGLSGGIDSALVATIAADALGPEQLRCISLPSPYTSPESISDAIELANNLRCQIDEIRIDGLQAKVDCALGGLFAGHPQDLTEENIQSRLRGLLLMAVSNKFGEMLLTTGNKSEAAVGYATIYGDMAGAYNPIKDLYKTRVFESCRWRNRNHRSWMKGPDGVCIPDQILEKPPSAELRPGQRDSDSLPPYEELDGILEILIDQDRSVAEAEAAGFDGETVRRVEQLVFGSEHKRFQSAPGLKLTERALWLDRRYPIVNHWRDESGGQSHDPA